MERLILTNGNVIRPTRIESGMAVVCRNGRIERILPGNGVTPEPGDRVIDARGGYIAPGFIDMHVHGGGGYDFMDGTVEAFLGVAETHARYGTTALVPTTLTCTDEELYRVFEVFREADRCNKRGARLLGWFVALLRFCCSPGRSFSLHGTGCGTGSGSGDSLCGFWRCFTSWSCTTSAFLTGYCSAIRTSFRIFIRR